MVRRNTQNFDYVILVSFLLLLVIGFVALASASSDLGKLEENDPYYYLKHQAIYGLSVGIVGFLIGFHLDYRKYKKLMSVLFFLAMVGLLLTFTPLGTSSGSVSRWIQLGPVTFQPSEFLKLFFIGYLAAWFSGNKSDRQGSMTEGFVPFLSISGVVAILLLIQKSTSAAIILMAGAFVVYVVGGAKKKYILASMCIGLVLFGGFILGTDYRRERVATFFNRNADVEDSGYQVTQAITTIGSGGVTGVGFGQSAIKTTLPERIGDSIFAVIAEEFGFIGSAFLILIFFTFVTRIFLLSKRSRDQFGKLLLVGFGTIIGAQALVHMGGNSGLVPLTGVPLPFISFGGSALAVFMTMTGIVLNISKKI